MRRKKLSRRASRKNFKRGNKVKGKNYRMGSAFRGGNRM